jgi:hypothetical protein
MYPGINIAPDRIKLLNHIGEEVLKVEYHQGYVLVVGYNRTTSCMNNDEFIEFLDTLKANIKRYDFQEPSV